MSVIPYRLSNQLSRNVFSFPFQVYRALHEVLISGDGIGLLTQFSREQGVSESVSDQASFFVLRHIALRTFLFSKTFEFIRIGDIADGFPTLGIAGAPIKHSTIKKTLRHLTDDHLIIKIQLPRSQAVTALYGLNIPALLTLLDLWWGQAIDERDLDQDNFDNLTKSVWSRRTQNILKCLSQYFGNFNEAFTFLTNQKFAVVNFDEFVDELKSYLPPWKLKDSDCTLELKTASRVRRKDLMPEKWRDIANDQGA